VILLQGLLILHCSLVLDDVHVFRWHNHLNPSINKEPWTLEEELALICAHEKCGNKWAELQKFLPGRLASL
jgi:hypothetical protein